MIKKIVLLAILTTILICGNLVAAGEDAVGLRLTVLSAYNSIPYEDQAVKAIISGVTQNKDTDENGLVKFGWLSSSGIYYIETVIDGETYTTTVEKQAGVVANRTWYIQEIKHDPE